MLLLHLKADWAFKTSLVAEGGNIRIAEEMANNLKHEVLLNKEVTSIDLSQDLAKVSCDDGTSFSADRIICSLPFSVLEGDINLSKNYGTHNLKP